MVRKNAKKKTKKPVAPPAPQLERQSDVFEEMLGTEVSPEKQTSMNVSSSGPTAQDFSLLRASQSPRKTLNRQPLQLAVTGSTSTVLNTTKSISPMATNQSIRSRPTVIEPDSHKRHSYGGSFSSCVTDTSNNSTQEQGGASRRKSQPTKQNKTVAGMTTRSSSNTLEQIAKLQTSTELLIPKLPFARLIREILLEYCNRDLRITPESLMCLQEAAEIYAVQLMEDAFRCTTHRDRITLTPKDMQLALMLRKDSVLL